MQYEATGNLDQDIAQLSQAPGLAWMAELKDDPNVDWQGITAAHREWKETQEGLGPAAAAVIAIAIAIATQGVGAGLLTSAGTTTTATTAAGATVTTGLGTITTTTAAGVVTTTSTTAGFAASAAFTSLVSQATLSVINNKGDLGAVFSDLTSADAVRSIAASALTAGLLNEVGATQVFNPSNTTAPEFFTHVQKQLLTAVVKTGVSSTIGGDDFSDSLAANLQFAAASVFGASVSKNIGEMIKAGDINKAQQLLAHALTGCITASIGGADCGSGATGAALGEAVADLSHALGLDQAEAAKMGRYAALASALVTADNALDVTYADLGASNAISNNFLLPKEKLELSKKLKACDGRPWCEAEVNDMFKETSDMRDEAFMKAYDACKADANNCAEFKAVHYDLRLELTEQGNAYYAEHASEFERLPDSKAIYHTYVTDDNGNVINETTEQLDGYKKYVHPVLGYEVVLDAQNNIVTDPVNAGTYNFYNPADPFASSNYLLEGWNLHTKFDVKPYFSYGNSADDTSTEGQRKNRFQVLWKEK